MLSIHKIFRTFLAELSILEHVEIHSWSEYIKLLHFSHRNCNGSERFGSCRSARPPYPLPDNEPLICKVLKIRLLAADFNFSCLFFLVDIHQISENIFPGKFALHINNLQLKTFLNFNSSRTSFSATWKAFQKDYFALYFRDPVTSYPESTYKNLIKASTFWIPKQQLIRFSSINHLWDPTPVTNMLSGGKNFRYHRQSTNT